MNQKYRSYRGEVANEAVSPKYAHTFGIKTLESLKHRIDRERTCNGGCIVAVYNVHAGHNPAGKIAQGAVGLLNESKENRLIKDEMIRYLRIGGNTVYDCTVDNGTSQKDVLVKIGNKCNAHTVDYDFSIHLNSGRKDPSGDGAIGGFEVWVSDGKNGKDTLAKRIRENMAALGFKDRGTKTTKNLYILNHTKAPALLLEICFVDDRDDYDLYQKVGYQAIAKAIAYAVMNKSMQEGAQNVASEILGRVGDGPEADGKWYYYENDRKVKKTTVAPNKSGWWYVKDGVVDFNFNGLAANPYGWWKIKGGAVDFSYTGIAGNDAGAWYVRDGAVDFAYNGEIKVKIVGGNVRLG